MPLAWFSLEHIAEGLNVISLGGAWGVVAGRCYQLLPEGGVLVEGDWTFEGQTEKATIVVIPNVSGVAFPQCLKYGYKTGTIKGV